MPRYNVEYNKKWACFSSVVDAFVTKFMNKESYEEWRKIQYGIFDYKQAEECNMLTMEEATFAISLNRSHDEWIDHLLKSGLTEKESEQLVYDCETKYCCPQLNKNRQYECPNCHEIVLENQKNCSNEFCENRLVWR